MLYAGDWMHDSGAAWTVIGTTIPVSHGDYAITGMHNGEPYYTHVDDTWLLWWTGTRYAISAALDVLEPGYWRQTAGGPPPAYYQPMGTFEGWSRLIIYQSEPFDVTITPVAQLGGGKSARLRRNRPNEKPTVRQIKVRSAMTIAQRCWSERMPPASQAEWLNNAINWDSWYGVPKFNLPYRRFCNVNLTLAHVDEPLIFAHTGRRYLDVEFVHIDEASAATQIITTITSVRQNFEDPCYTLLSYFQVWPLAVEAPRYYYYMRLLGFAYAEALPFQPDWTWIQHFWSANYELVEGDTIKILLRYTCDNDAGFAPAEWAPFTRTHVSDIVEVGP